MRIDDLWYIYGYSFHVLFALRRRLAEHVQKGGVMKCSQTKARHCIDQHLSRSLHFQQSQTRSKQGEKEEKLCNLPLCLMTRYTVFLTPKMTHQSHCGIHPLLTSGTYECLSTDLNHLINTQQLRHSDNYAEQFHSGLEKFIWWSDENFLQNSFLLSELLRKLIDFLLN